MKVETSNMSNNDLMSDTSADEDRRKFLATCGKFAAVTPPAITMLLSTSLNSKAIASLAITEMATAAGMEVQTGSLTPNVDWS